MKASSFYYSGGKFRLVLSLLITVSLFVPAGTSAQAKTERIAILKSADIAPYNQAIEAFKHNVPAHQSLVHEYNLDGNIENGTDIVRSIFDSKADLVLAVGLKAALVAKFEIRDIPVIFCMVLNPKKFNLVAPNLKGISLATPFREQLLLLRSIIPKVRRIGILYDPEKSAYLMKKSQNQAQELGFQLVARGVSSQKELPTTLRKMLTEVDAIALLPDSTVLTEDSFDFLLSETLDKHVPVMGFSSGLVRKGALVGTYINYDDVGEQAAGLANDLLNGSSLNSPSLIEPRRIRKAINLNTAHFLGLSISPDVLKDFDKRY